jgi:hypothetical protein
MIPHFLPLLEIIEQNHALVAFSDTRNIFKKKQILPLEVCFCMKQVSMSDLQFVINKKK